MGTAPGQFGVLDTNTEAILAGRLEITVDPVFIPSIGDRFDVIETGAGVFGRFEHVQFPTLSGTGLGLSTAARIASSHGGTLRVEDAPGGGAIFRVRWPREEAPSKDEEKTVEREPLTL